MSRSQTEQNQNDPLPITHKLHAHRDVDLGLLSIDAYLVSEPRDKMGPSNFGREF